MSRAMDRSKPQPADKPTYKQIRLDIERRILTGDEARCYGRTVPWSAWQRACSTRTFGCRARALHGSM